MSDQIDKIKKGATTIREVIDLGLSENLTDRLIGALLRKIGADNSQPNEEVKFGFQPLSNLDFDQ